MILSESYNLLNQEGKGVQTVKLCCFLSWWHSLTLSRQHYEGNEVCLNFRVVLSMKERIHLRLPMPTAGTVSCPLLKNETKRAFKLSAQFQAAQRTTAVLWKCVRVIESALYYTVYRLQRLSAVVSKAFRHDQSHTTDI